MSSRPNPSVPITLKWGKTIFSSKISVNRGSHAELLKRQVQALTNVPPPRQKLLCPKYWKGALKDTDNLPVDFIVPKGMNSIIVTLIGSAEVLVEKTPEERVRFVEDMTTEEVKEAEKLAAGHDSAEESIGVGDIVALQRTLEDRNDGKMEMYQYNRLVNGLPQQQIEDKLRIRREHSDPPGVAPALLGEVVMTMGVELRRAYVNSLTVLDNGTLVSGLDDGHVQLWRRGELVKDVVHQGIVDTGGVDQVVSFQSSGVDVPAFATGGRGSIRIWSDDADSIMNIPSHLGTSPASLAIGSIPSNGQNGNIKVLASCFKVTRQINRNRFRLVPQDEAGRQRREAAELQEHAIQEALGRTSQCVQVWFYNCIGSDGVADGFGSEIISPTHGEDDAPVTKVAVSSENLVCGDARGGLRIFKLVVGSTLESFSCQRSGFLQFQSSGFDCSISCMEPMVDNLMVISTDAQRNSTQAGTRVISSATPLHVTHPSAVYIVDLDRGSVRVVLNAHSDAVQCICPLPNGGILTGGGKMDATVRMWDSMAISTALQGNHENSEDVPVLMEADTLTELGYVFDLKVLPDAEPSSCLFAVAGARYNVVKIVI
jgi:WD40 repeat protein